MKVLLADDHQIVREGIRRILEECADVTTIGEAESADEVLQSVRKQDWDILVLDINLQGKSGLEVLKEVKHERPKLPVLVLSMYPEDQFAVRVIRAGASGYLTKTGASTELVNAIRQIAGGRKYITPKVADELADALDTRDDAPLHATLSDREFEVFRMIAAGKTVGAVAQALHLSVKTISTYRTNILRKMKMKNNADIMQYAVTHRLGD